MCVNVFFFALVFGLPRSNGVQRTGFSRDCKISKISKVFMKFSGGLYEISLRKVPAFFTWDFIA